MQNIPISEILWSKSYRIIPSRFPPIDLFERVAGSDDWDALCELETYTNPRVREELGQINIVPKNRRVFGSGAGYVMAAFTHFNKLGSRFSDGSYGVYYAAKTLKTSHIETISKMERFYAVTQEDNIGNDFRVLLGKIQASFHDITGSSELWKKYHDSDNWADSQKIAAYLRNEGSNGILYNSVRHEGGKCVAVFWPDIVCLPVHAQHVRYHWNGKKIDKYYDFSRERWFSV